MKLPPNVRTDLSTVIDEVYRRRVYMPEGFAFQRRRPIIDIGANVGVFSGYCAGNAVSCVHAYEPHPENFKCLEANVSPWGQVVTTYNEAVSDIEGSIKLFLSDYAGGHLVFSASGEGALHRNVSVPCVTFRTVMERAGGAAQLVKMDCEGAEGLIFGSIDLRQYDVEAYAIEYHDNVSPMSASAIKAQFEESGYLAEVTGREGPFGYIHAIRK